jgi:hypothetical protein
MFGLSDWLSTGAVSIWLALNGFFGDVFKTQGLEGRAEGGAKDG